jgi:hypothetical protein
MDTIDSDLDEDYNFRIQKLSGNETKNIPKNFGKAILSFI